VAARAAVAPGDRRVTAKHLFDGNVMVGSAVRAQVCDTRLFDLARGQSVQRFTGGHVEINDITPATADFTINTPTFGSLLR
jgi:glucose dehydrogenase